MEEQSKIYHLGMISVEIFKQDNKVRYQLMIPLGSSWQDAINVCDEFKTALVELQQKAASAEEAKEQVS